MQNDAPRWRQIIITVFDADGLVRATVPKAEIYKPATGSFSLFQLMTP
jgi:hypothetical protein